MSFAFRLKPSLIVTIGESENFVPRESIFLNVITIQVNTNEINIIKIDKEILIFQ